MKSYYEALESSLGATAGDIKKAYFKMVRKCPPDKYPDEFMEIRKAYEILSNEKTKKEYDMFASMPEKIRIDFEQAKKCLEENDISRAISLLEDILIREPELLIPKSLLAQGYMINGNTGKAVKIYEELVKKEKNNAGFRGELAHAYLHRKYNKKAIKAYEKAIEYDEDNISLWLGLSDAYMMSDLPRDARNILQQAIEISSSKEVDITSLYFKIIFIDIAINAEKEMEEDLDKLAKIAVEREDLRENVTWSILKISKLLSDMGRNIQAIIMVDAASRIMPENKEITMFKDELIKFEKVQEQFEELSDDDRFNEDIVALIALEILPLYELDMDEEERDEQETMGEMMLLVEREKHINDIKNLKRYYPQLYKVKEEFFEGVLNNKQSQKLLKRYEKKFNQMSFLNEPKSQNRIGNFDDDWYDEEDRDEPFIREEEKIGRNDSCSCGSGKKYKKCCGKNK